MELKAVQNKIYEIREEYNSLRSQIVMSSGKHRGLAYRPFVLSTGIAEIKRIGFKK
ncbi:MAG: hypothetical protein H0W61_03020 [Bacteroidetes bacterium]|nr:hypothetical protein [Bacteroidota bacterium]